MNTVIKLNQFEGKEVSLHMLGVISSINAIIEKYGLKYYTITEESRGDCKYLNVNISIKLGKERK